MAVATRKRPKNFSVSKSALDQAGSLLQDLPQKAKEDLSLREAVDQLQEQVRAALAKGYSYDEVATLLDGKGIEISASTLKRYVSLSSRQAGKTKSASTRAQTGRARKNQAAAPTVKTQPEQAPENRESIAAVPAPEPAEKPAKGRRKATTTAPEAKPAKTTRSRTAAKAAPAKATTKSSATRGRKKASS